MAASDLIYTLRSLRRAPEFTIVTVATIAVGICVTAVVFGHVNNVLLKPLPLPDGGRIIAITSHNKGDWTAKRGVESRDVGVLQHHPFSTLESISVVRPFNNLFTAGGYSQPLEGEMVSGNYFDFFQVRPRLGRLLTPADDVNGAEPVMVISEPCWQSAFGGDADIVGKSVRVAGEPLVIVGVAPRSFRGIVFANFIARDYWVPRAALRLFTANMEARKRQAAENGEEAVLGRLRRGTDRRMAAAEIGALSGMLLSDQRFAIASPSRVLAPPPVVRAAGAILLALSAIVLLIAGLNITTLLLARAESRSAEIAVRIMTGASRRHIARLVTLEAAVLSVAGGLAGLLVASLVLRTLGSVPVWIKFHTFRYDATADRSFVLFGCVLIASLIVAVSRRPARIAAETAPLQVVAARAALQGIGTPSRGSQRRLILAQIASATVLMTWAGLFGRAAFGPLFAAPHVSGLGVVAAEFHLGYFTSDRATGRVLHRRLSDAAAATPTASAWALASALPFGDAGQEHIWEAEGGDPGLLRAGFDCRTISVSGDLFGALGIAVVRGDARPLVATSSPERVAVVNESAAAYLWPGEAALGRRIRQHRPGQDPSWLTVVAVVQDTVSPLARPASRRIVFVSSDAVYEAAGFVMLRARSSPAKTGAELVRTLRVVAPDLDVYRVRPLRDTLAAQQAGLRSAATTLVLLAVLGALVAVSGAYASVAYEVRRKARDVAVRKALGATNAQIYQSTVLGNLAPIAAAIAFGIVVAVLTTSPLLGAVHIGVPAWDAAVFSTVPLLLLGVCAAACFVPAYRATKAEPMRLLRDC